MPGADHYDAIVVGGGIVGCMSAYWLSKRGLKVALVEKGVIANGTTANSFAWINATSKFADESYHRLNALGASIYRELCTEFGEQELGLNPCGMLKLVRRSDEDAYKLVQEQAATLQSFGYPTSWVDRQQLAALEPHLALQDDVEALHALADPCMDAPACTRFIAAQIQRLGATVLENCSALSLDMDDAGKVVGLETDKGTLASERVLLCAGPNTPEVLSELTGYEGFASRFPMTKVPGVLVTSPSTAPHRLARHVLYMASGSEFHVLPAANGGLKVGADDTDGRVADEPSAQTIREAALELLARTQALIPNFAGESIIDQCQVGIGVRPYPQDGKSLAGPLPGAEGLFIVATHSGITLAPAIGKLMSEVVAEGTTPPELEPFSLDRFQAFNV